MSRLCKAMTTALAAAVFAMTLITVAAASPGPQSSHAGGVVVLPHREDDPTSERVRDMAVAFVAAGGDNEEAVLDKVVQARIPRIMVVASWSGMCPAPGACTYDAMDRTIERAEARGLGVIVHINSTPDWVHPDLVDAGVPEQERIWYTPTRTEQELQHWADFNGALSARYAGRVLGYEIWNEQNWREFMRPAEDAPLYAAMLRASSLAIKGHDRAADVIFGGMTRSDVGFLSDTYDALAAYPDAADNGFFFDQVGVHPYTDSSAPDNPAVLPRENAAGGEFDDNFLGFDRVHAEMVRRGDGHKTIFMGEFAYSLNDWFRAESDEARAFFLRRAYELAAQRPWISGLAWFQFNVAAPDSAWDDWSLLTWPAQETASYRELKELTGASPAEDAVELTIERAGGGIRASVPALPSGATLQVYANGVKVAEGPTGTLSFTPQAQWEGSTVLLQAVVLQPGRATQSALEYLALGDQAIQLRPADVKVGRGVDVQIGGRDGAAVRLLVTDQAGRVALDRQVEPIGPRTPTRQEFLVWLGSPGTYTVRALSAQGDAVAVDAQITVR